MSLRDNMRLKFISHAFLGRSSSRNLPRTSLACPVQQIYRYFGSVTLALGPCETRIEPVPWAGPPALFAFLLLASVLAAAAQAQAQSPLRERLRALPYKIAYECYVNDNWEIFVMNADGSDPVNLTRTPKAHEHYPQISPDATKILLCHRRGGRTRCGPQPVGHGH